MKKLLCFIYSDLFFFLIFDIVRTELCSKRTYNSAYGPTEKISNSPNSAKIIVKYSLLLHILQMYFFHFDDLAFILGSLDLHLSKYTMLLVLPCEKKIHSFTLFLVETKKCRDTVIYLMSTTFLFCWHTNWKLSLLKVIRLIKYNSYYNAYMGNYGSFFIQPYYSTKQYLNNHNHSALIYYSFDMLACSISSLKFHKRSKIY